MDINLKGISDLFMEVVNDFVIKEETSLKRGPLNNFTISEVHTVNAIGLFGKETMSNTAKKLNVTVGTLTTGINNLVKKGAVYRYKDENDRRIVLVGLSKKGRVLYRAHDKFHKDLFEDIIGDLTKDELQLLYSLLNKIHKKINLLKA